MVREVILSGGDPLGLTNSRLNTLFDYIKRLSFVKRVRIHSRFPVLVPERVTPPLLEALARLQESGKSLFLVFHLNHPAEINDRVMDVFRRFARLGITLLSQTVLLRGINDDPKILADLYEKIAEASVLPYYLHQLDRVSGAAHFEVPTDRGLANME